MKTQNLETLRYRDGVYRSIADFQDNAEPNNVVEIKQRVSLPFDAFGWRKLAIQQETTRNNTRER